MERQCGFGRYYRYAYRKHTYHLHRYCYRAKWLHGINYRSRCAKREPTYYQHCSPYDLDVYDYLDYLNRYRRRYLPMG